MYVCEPLFPTKSVAHSYQMALSVWRDEYNGGGTINGKKISDIVDSPSEGEPEEEDASAPGPARDSSPSAPTSPPTGHGASSGASSPIRPPSSASERSSAPPASDDDFDIDAMIQEDAERQAATLARQPSPQLYGATSKSSTTYRSNPNARQPDPDDMDEDEDDALWSAFNDPSIFDDPSLVAASTTAPTSVNPHAAPDDDEDMWEMFNDMEADEQRTRVPKNVVQPPAQKEPAPPAPAPAAVVEPPMEDRRATNDEGWDEMYL